MNRLVRTRMLGGVGRAGEKPALTRLDELFIHKTANNSGNFLTVDYRLMTLVIYHGMFNIDTLFRGFCNIPVC